MAARKKKQKAKAKQQRRRRPPPKHVLPHEDGPQRTFPTFWPHTWQRAHVDGTVFWCGACGAMKFLHGVIVTPEPRGFGYVHSPENLEPGCFGPRKA